MNIFDCANVTSVSNGTEWTGANHTRTDHVVRLLMIRTRPTRSGSSERMPHDAGDNCNYDFRLLVRPSGPD